MNGRAQLPSLILFKTFIKSLSKSLEVLKRFWPGECGRLVKATGFLVREIILIMPRDH
jgi:hypothetical protein